MPSLCFSKYFLPIVPVSRQRVDSSSSTEISQPLPPHSKPLPPAKNNTIFNSLSATTALVVDQGLHNTMVCLPCPCNCLFIVESPLLAHLRDALPASSWRKGDFGTSGTARIDTPSLPRCWSTSHLLLKMPRPACMLTRWCCGALCGGKSQLPAAMFFSLSEAHDDHNF